MGGNVERFLQQWAAHADDEELDLGPGLADLGGVETVLQEAGEIARGPRLPYLLSALARGLADLPPDARGRLAEAVLTGLRTPHAAWILSEAMDVLCRWPPLLDLLGRKAARILADHTEDALAGDGQAALAQPAVAGLLRLCLAGQASPHRLLTLLTEITGQESPAALERLPILIGIAHDHYPDAELVTVLTTLHHHAGLPDAARADAGYELAVVELRGALDGSDRAAVETGLRRALLRFSELDRTQEARLDARAYASALEAVLAFTPELSAPGAHRPDLAAAADRLEQTVQQGAAWRGRLHQLDWLSARGLAQSAWSRLVENLRTAQHQLAQPSWYSPATALNDLLQIYLASRAVHTCTAAPAEPGHGLEALVSPTVEAAFVRHDGLLHHLEQALALDPAFTGHPDAQALHAAVQQRRSRADAGGQDVMPGKALAGHPALSALFGSGAALPADRLDQELLDRLEGLVQQSERGYTPTGNARVDAKMEELLAVLRRSPAWTKPDSDSFTLLLESFLRFVHDRFDGQADLYGERTAYLGPPRPKDDGSPGVWPEKAVQDDLHQHLSGMLTPGSVQREIIDVASGRTDVTYTPRPGRRFVLEVKRRKTAYSREAVARDYLAQAANYTATGPPFGMLLVGDHSNHRGGYSGFDDRVWITSCARSATEVPRLVVVAVLPIARPTPSALRLPSLAH
ncbi:hypothetical protein [Streptomyces olivaceus]|uniref:hypothetical protein n=1 Tax=Streptomyces olivaceus TaxID=47716 RepID=UPI001CC9D12D|nr:hypothetical protein [Streptomyces olivaceus]MBZ6135450.1 hypothetical protein [Streptomyces olivaceus]